MLEATVLHAKGTPFPNLQQQFPITAYFFPSKIAYPNTSNFPSQKLGIVLFNKVKHHIVHFSIQ